MGYEALFDNHSPDTGTNHLESKTRKKIYRSRKKGLRLQKKGTRGTLAQVTRGRGEKMNVTPLPQSWCTAQNFPGVFSEFMVKRAERIAGLNHCPSPPFFGFRNRVFWVDGFAHSSEVGPNLHHIVKYAPTAAVLAWLWCFLPCFVFRARDLYVGNFDM